MRFLLILLAVASLVGLGIQRTPKIPPLPDYAKIRPTEVDPTMPAMGVFQLGADIEKSPETVAWVRNVAWAGTGCDSPL